MWQHGRVRRTQGFRRPEFQFTLLWASHFLSLSFKFITYRLCLLFAAFQDFGEDNKVISYMRSSVQTMKCYINATFWYYFLLSILIFFYYIDKFSKVHGISLALRQWYKRIYDFPFWLLPHPGLRGKISSVIANILTVHSKIRALWRYKIHPASIPLSLPPFLLVFRFIR